MIKKILQSRADNIILRMEALLERDDEAADREFAKLQQLGQSLDMMTQHMFDIDLD